MIKVKEYDSYNSRRYGRPWIAIIGKDGKPNFNIKVGGYTGEYGTGQAGYLYLRDDAESGYYMFGQKDYRGGNTEKAYIIFDGEQIKEITRQELLESLL